MKLREPFTIWLFIAVAIFVSALRQCEEAGKDCGCEVIKKIEKIQTER